MNWKFDIDQRSLTQASDDLFVRSAKLAYPDRYPVKVSFFRGTTPYTFTGDLRATVKPLNQQSSSGPLAVMVAPVANSSVAEGILNLSTVPMLSFIRKFGERPVALELLVVGASGQEIASWTVNCETSRRYTDTDDIAESLPDLKATQEEAEQGASNTKWMTPLRVWQAIAKWAQVTLGSAAYANSTAFAPSNHTHTLPDIEQALESAGIELE